jgi:hypothetical protein
MEHLGLLLRKRAGTAKQGNRKGIRRNACIQAHDFLPEAFSPTIEIDYNDEDRL